MGNVGSFGTARPASTEDLTFDYFDGEYRLHPDATDLALVDFMSLAGDLESADAEKAGMAAMTALGSSLRRLIHPEDYDAVMTAARANRQTIEDITELAMGLAAAVAARPTERLTDSSAGPSSTSPSSTGASSSLDARQSVIRRFEEQGRPDLALVVMDAPERASA